MIENKYIGIPFVDLGRSREGCDCWGLLKLFYEAELKLELPDLLDYQSTEESSKIRDIIREESTSWERVDEPRFGDAIVIKFMNISCHVGLYLRNGLMLHTQKGVGSGIERLDSPKWANRIDGYYRKS